MASQCLLASFHPNSMMTLKLSLIRLWCQRWSIFFIFITSLLKTRMKEVASNSLTLEPLNPHPNLWCPWVSVIRLNNDWLNYVDEAAGCLTIAIEGENQEDSSYICDLIACRYCLSDSYILMNVPKKANLLFKFGRLEKIKSSDICFLISTLNNNNKLTNTF